MFIYNYFISRWRIHRKFTLNFMKSFGMSRSGSSVIKLEEKILDCIDELMNSKFISNIISNILFTILRILIKQGES